MSTYSPDCGDNLQAGTNITCFVVKCRMCDKPVAPDTLRIFRFVRRDLEGNISLKPEHWCSISCLKKTGGRVGGGDEVEREQA